MEKVLYINLPDGADYRRVEVTEDGRIGIVYTERCVNNEETIEVPLTTALPKPIPLIGGTEVYQKDNGTSYWYCKIKEGRDEFMYLYFDDLTEADLRYDKNGKSRNFTTISEKHFSYEIMEALKNKPKKGFTWIPVYEPSPDGKGNVQYVSRENVLTKLLCSQWEKVFKAYSPENGSHIASITTYFLLLLRWLKDGIATNEQLVVDSKEIGHYYDSENAKHDAEKTGERQFGGLEGFAGNTYKIVKDSRTYSGFSLLGGNCHESGSKCPLSYVKFDVHPHTVLINGVGLVELDK